MFYVKCISLKIWILFVLQDDFTNYNIYCTGNRLAYEISDVASEVPYKVKIAKVNYIFATTLFEF